MAATKPMTISLPADLLRETQRVAGAEDTTPAKLVEAALRQWGTDTAKRLGLKSEADLERFLQRERPRARKRRR